MTTAVSRTDLARNTRHIVEQVRRGETVLVQSYGEDQIVLLDAFDYRLLRAVAACVLEPAVTEGDDKAFAVVRSYLDEQISLSNAAEQLGLSRYELLERFERLGVPLHIGPATIEDALIEMKAARQIASGA